MKKQILAALAAAMALTVTSAFAQGHMQHGMKQQTKPPMMHKGGDMNMMDTMMMGLSADEKKMAMDHFSHMSQAEKDVMHKRMMMCMKDAHKGMMSMMKGKSHKEMEAMEMKHMMSGLSMSEQKTMMHMWSKMDMKHKMVAEKMMMNCCMYGMKHAK